MDYTKILSALSRVKDALEKKIDAVNTSVSGLPDTLDTQFTAVKNDIATVKTEVLSVKTDTETNLPQKFDAGTQEIKTELNSITERVATIEKDVRNDAKTHAVKGVVIKKKNTPNPTELIMSITGKGTLYIATLSGGLVNSKLIVELDGKLVSIVNNSHNNFNIGISTTEAFNWSSEGNNRVIRYRFVELTEASSNVYYDKQIKVNGITKNYYKLYCPSLVTISDELFVDKDVNIVVDKDNSTNTAFGRDKGYQFTKSLKVYIDFSTIANSTTYAATEVMYRLEE